MPRIRGARRRSSIAWHRACDVACEEEHDATFHLRFDVREQHDGDCEHRRHRHDVERAMKVLVACHARAPMTRVVADEVATVLGADVDLIIPRRTTDGFVGWLRSTYETTFDCATDVVAPAQNLDAYDVIIIGSPAWRGGIASPVRTYIERQRVRLRTIALFTTCDDGGGDRAVDEMTLLCRRDPLARLVVREPELRSGRAHADIADFARRITARASRRPAAA
jgi:hypothetical protein